MSPDRAWARHELQSLRPRAPRLDLPWLPQFDCPAQGQAAEGPPRKTSDKEQSMTSLATTPRSGSEITRPGWPPSQTTSRGAGDGFTAVHRSVLAARSRVDGR